MSLAITLTLKQISKRYKSDLSLAIRGVLLLYLFGTLFHGTQFSDQNRFPGHWMCRLEPHPGWWTRSGVVSLAETGRFSQSDGIRVDFWSRTGWRYGHSHSNSAAFTAFLAIYNVCIYIYIYIYTCTFVKCLKPTSKDSKNNNKKRKLMRKKNTVWRKGKTKAKTNQRTILKKQKKQNQQQKKATWIYIYMRLFFSSVCFAFFSVSFSVFSFAGDLMTRTFENVKHSRKKTNKKKRKKQPHINVFWVCFFFCFWFCVFLLFVSLLSCSDCFFCFAL